MRGLTFLAISLQIAAGGAAPQPVPLPTPAPPSAREAAAIESGRKLFIRCTACHSLSASAPAMVGPHLQGIVGRPVASVSGFHYNTAIRTMTFNWTKPRLERLLRQPQKLAPVCACHSRAF